MKGVRPDLSGIKKFVDRLRNPMLEKASSLHCDLVTRLAVDVIDLHALNLLGPECFGEKIKGPISPLVEANFHVMKRQKKVKDDNLRDPEVDFEVDLYFFHVKEKLLCMFFAERKEFREIFEGSRGVEEYGYWNNTDRPDGISSREWNQRLSDWKKAIPELSVVTDHGFKISLVGDHALGLVHRKEAIPFVQEKGRRAEKLAKRLLLNERMRKMSEGVNIRLPEEMMRLFHQATEWQNSDDGKIAHAKKIEEILPKLKDLTEEDLTLKITPNLASEK